MYLVFSDIVITPVDPYLIFEKIGWKNQVWRTEFFQMDFSEIKYISTGGEWHVLCNVYPVAIMTMTEKTRLYAQCPSLMSHHCLNSKIFDPIVHVIEQKHFRGKSAAWILAVKLHKSLQKKVKIRNPQRKWSSPLGWLANWNIIPVTVARNFHST